MVEVANGMRGPSVISIRALLAHWAYTGVAAVLMAVGGAFLVGMAIYTIPDMLWRNGNSWVAAAGFVSAVALWLPGYLMWISKGCGRGWDVVAGITLWAVIWIAVDLAFGGLVATGGDPSKIGRGPLVKGIEHLLREEGL